MTYTIAQINSMSQDEFVAALGAVFEETPAIARSTWQKRPFADVTDLHQQMVNAVKAMSKQQQLTLIRVHPDLGSKVKMAEASVQEQSGVGLDRLTAQEYQRFEQLNAAYKAKFGFPLIVAVKNHTKDSIFATFDERLENSADREFERAIAEIYQIAQFRLLAIVL
ncbi:2-oxo-4-hydroxy-4-carboxy-5-ureidoimidazoline decarboxylase [Aliterella atlantica]|uniref:2-oxo-4-hydroxy-4-carboxy-5-ureidoimidazoline decarboxylase n=1 Tax=Aliterella atlantica CENA595 TaxID=1618023 RepID=A0A0D8ZUB0_9CYAN|nr:2-oxo-4-hydroxy-4-carboxy-5-ureidoimidazoline decarboxylase [Aliterella atlantica]KJH70826.1 OHCU decarboxylase [Aliterella atlantica CENA595]